MSEWLQAGNCCLAVSSVHAHSPHYLVPVSCSWRWVVLVCFLVPPFRPPVELPLPAALCSFLQPVLMSAGHTPLYTSAVSTLVRAQGPGGRRKNPPFATRLHPHFLHHLCTVVAFAVSFCGLLFHVRLIPFSMAKATVFQCCLQSFCTGAGDIWKHLKNCWIAAAFLIVLAASFDVLLWSSLVCSHYGVMAGVILQETRSSNSILNMCHQWWKSVCYLIWSCSNLILDSIAYVLFTVCVLNDIRSCKLFLSFSCHTLHRTEHFEECQYLRNFELDDLHFLYFLVSWCETRWTRNSSIIDTAISGI